MAKANELMEPEKPRYVQINFTLCAKWLDPPWVDQAEKKARIARMIADTIERAAIQINERHNVYVEVKRAENGIE